MPKVKFDSIFSRVLTDTSGTVDEGMFTFLLMLHQVGTYGIQIIIEFAGVFIPEFSNFRNDRVIHHLLLKVHPASTARGNDNLVPPQIA